MAILALAPILLHAQAGPRTDTPPQGKLRVSFDPVITTSEREFTADGHEQRLSATLDSITTLLVRSEKRVTPLRVDFGITNRVSVGVYLPLVRVNARESFPQDSMHRVADTAGFRRLDSLLADTTWAFDPLIGTRRHLHYFAGDIELEAKYRLLESPRFALSGALVVRLPTGHQDSPNNLFDIATGDHQTDIELQVAQELTLLNRFWINGLVRAGRQQPGTRSRRIGPQSQLLIPRAALATLNWDPGDYARIDVAPMLLVAKQFAVGLTVGYYTQQQDRYSYRNAQDSIDVANHLGAPVSASVLDAETAYHWARLGFAMTYKGSDVEGSLSFEQTVTGSARVPVMSVYRIVMRTS
ncbi:MAG TPA: hypothetical protein VE714_11580, partial [Gemmatimonadales bacterium]|nr:hypothetical protein [Gemmatimonadales bacterium]